LLKKKWVHAAASWFSVQLAHRVTFVSQIV
jgi:hypothetical protein